MQTKQFLISIYVSTDSDKAEQDIEQLLQSIDYGRFDLTLVDDKVSALQSSVNTPDRIL